jgi:hypothetical protein
MVQFSWLLGAWKFETRQCRDLDLDRRRRSRRSCQLGLDGRGRLHRLALYLRRRLGVVREWGERVAEIEGDFEA